MSDIECVQEKVGQIQCKMGPDTRMYKNPGDK